MSMLARRLLIAARRGADGLDRAGGGLGAARARAAARAPARRPTPRRRPRSGASSARRATPAAEPARGRARRADRRARSSWATRSTASDRAARPDRDRPSRTRPRASSCSPSVPGSYPIELLEAEPADRRARDPRLGDVAGARGLRVVARDAAPVPSHHGQVTGLRGRRPGWRSRGRCRGRACSGRGRGAGAHRAAHVAWAQPMPGGARRGARASAALPRLGIGADGRSGGAGAASAAPPCRSAALEAPAAEARSARARVGDAEEDAVTVGVPSGERAASASTRRGRTPSATASSRAAW